MAHEPDLDEGTQQMTNRVRPDEISDRTDGQEAENENQKDDKPESDPEDTSPSNDSDINHSRVVEILEILKNGFCQMNIDTIVGALCENATWMEHPHDATRHYYGLAQITEMLQREFQGKQDSKMIFFPDTIIFDKRSGVAHVEWLQSEKDLSSEGNVRERHSSHSVLMKFKRDKIESIRFHSIKTNKYWTQEIVSGRKSKKKRRNKKKSRNGNRNNGKNGHRGGSNRRKRRTRGRNLNGHQKNDKSNGADYELHNSSEQKPVAEEVGKPKNITNKNTPSSTSRSRGRSQRYSQDRGRGNRQTRGRNNGRYSNGKGNGRYHSKRGGRGKGKKKKNDFKEDLPETSQKQQDSVEKAQQQQVQLQNNTESSV